MGKIKLMSYLNLQTKKHFSRPLREKIKKLCYETLSNTKCALKFHYVAKMLLEDMENLEDSYETEKKPIKRNTKPTPIVGVDEKGNIIYEFPSFSDGERNGFNQAALSLCCRKKYLREGNNHFKGYQWFYKEEWEKIKNPM